MQLVPESTATATACHYSLPVPIPFTPQNMSKSSPVSLLEISVCIFCSVDVSPVMNQGLVLYVNLLFLQVVHLKLWLRCWLQR